MNNALLETGYTFKLPSYFLKHLFFATDIVPNVQMHASNSFEMGKVIIWKREFSDNKNRWRKNIGIASSQNVALTLMNSCTWQEIKMIWRYIFGKARCEFSPRLRVQWYFRQILFNNFFFIFKTCGREIDFEYVKFQFYEM